AKPRRGGGPLPLPPSPGRVLPAINPLADRPRLLAGREGGPVRPTADPESALGPVEPVGQQEGLCPFRVLLRWGEHANGEAGKARVEMKSRSFGRCAQVPDNSLG